jgi:hypothetical protein
VLHLASPKASAAPLNIASIALALDMSAPSYATRTR